MLNQQIVVTMTSLKVVCVFDAQVELPWVQPFCHLSLWFRVIQSGGLKGLGSQQILLG
jgi:hypothetical protein